MINSIISSQLINEYQYFLFGGDDLYVVVKNLKSFLLSSKIKNLNKNHSNPLYIGRILKQNHYLSFISGGSGYILNRLSIRILADMLNLPSSPCLPTLQTSKEDVMIAHCLKLAGVLPVNYDDLFDIDKRIVNASVGNSSDKDDDNSRSSISDSNKINSRGNDFNKIVNNFSINNTCNYNESNGNDDCKAIKSRKSSIFCGDDDDDDDDDDHCVYSWYDYDSKEIFHPIPPSQAYTGELWLNKMSKNYKLGDDCCSKYSISFHSIATSFRMRCFDYLIHSNDQNR